MATARARGSAATTIVTSSSSGSAKQEVTPPHRLHGFTGHLSGALESGIITSIPMVAATPAA